MRCQSGPKPAFTMQIFLDTEDYTTNVFRRRKLRYKSWLGRLRKLCEQICHVIFGRVRKLLVGCFFSAPLFTMQTFVDTENYATNVFRGLKKACVSDLSRKYRQIGPGVRKLPRNLRLTRQRVRYIFDLLFSRPFFTIQILRIPRVTVRMCPELEKHLTKAVFV